MKCTCGRRKMQLAFCPYHWCCPKNGLWTFYTTIVGGVGKTALVRTIGGIWQNGRGAISLPGRTLFLPQTVWQSASAVDLPSAKSEGDDDYLRQIVRTVVLSHLEEYGKASAIPPSSGTTLSHPGTISD